MFFKQETLKQYILSYLFGWLPFCAPSSIEPRLRVGSFFAIASHKSNRLPSPSFYPRPFMETGMLKLCCQMNQLKTDKLFPTLTYFFLIWVKLTLRSKWQLFNARCFPVPVGFELNFFPSLSNSIFQTGELKK